MSDLKHLPKGYQLPENNFSKEEWKEYFQYRKERDIEMSLDEIEFWLELMEQEFKRWKQYRRWKMNKVVEKCSTASGFIFGISTAVFTTSYYSIFCK